MRNDLEAIPAYTQASAALMASGLSKAYGATVALAHADIVLSSGKVHALLGENGAGKSTLVRILAGAVTPDSGQILVWGKSYAPRSLIEARSQQVATAFQELSLVPNLTVAQNLLIPYLPCGTGGLIQRRRVREAGAEILARHGLERIHPETETARLPLAERQRLEIVRALENAGRILILDEPTAALAETDWLFERIRMMTERGVAVLYVSHRLAEVRELCAEATVLRNGRSIASVNLTQACDMDIFEMMVGRKENLHLRKRNLAPAAGKETRLSARDLGGAGLNGISFDLRSGEILALAALEGQGQRNLFQMLAGLAQPQTGEMTLDGRAISYSSPRQALKTGSGIAYLPEERKTEGILSGLTTATNVILPVLSRAARAGLIPPRAEESTAQTASDKVDLNPGYLRFLIDDLSGGNQQKALLARTLATGAKTLLLFDPTRGVDVGTKQAIYAAIRNFTEEGGSVLFYSSELPEVVQLADRCLVLYGGRVFGQFEGEEIAERTLVAAMLGQGAPSAAGQGVRS